MVNVRQGRLAGKVAIVTGAAGSIGIQTCIQFAREGASVLMTGRTLSKLHGAMAQVLEQVPDAQRVESLQCDVANEADMVRTIGAVEDWGGVDILFNNAGIVHSNDTGAIETPESAWDETQNVNVKGVWYGCKHAILSMRRNRKKSASIINNASITGLIGSAVPQLAYVASKGAVLAMTRELAITHAREGFRFNALCPGPTKSDMLDGGIPQDSHEIKRRTAHFPTGQFATCKDQALAVVFLASDESSFITGTDFVVDGGLIKAYVCAED